MEVQVAMGKERGTPNEVLLKTIAISTFDSGIEEELQRRKTRLIVEDEVFEKEVGDTAKDAPTLESRLSIATGVLQATLAKLSLEKGRYSQEAANLRAKTKENQAAIDDYLLKLAELESVGQVIEQISKELRNLNLGAEFGQKTVTRLDVPIKGSFVGPYMIRFLGIGALLGFIAFCALAFLNAIVTVRRTAT